MWTLAVRDAAASLGFGTWVSTAAGCWAFGSAQGDRDCSVHSQFVDTALEELPAGIVVVAHSDIYFDARPGDLGRFIDDFSVWLSRITARGHRVVIVEPIPRFSLRAEEASLPTLLSWGRKAPSFRPSEDGSLRHVMRDELRILAQRPGVNTLDMVPRICPSDLCVPKRGELFIFKDSFHISNQFAGQLGSEFARAVDLVG